MFRQVGASMWPVRLGDQAKAAFRAAPTLLARIPELAEMVLVALEISALPAAQRTAGLPALSLECRVA